MTALKLENTLFSQPNKKINSQSFSNTIILKRKIDIIIKTTNNSNEIYDWLIELFELTKEDNISSFLNFLREKFEQLTSNQKIDILNYFYKNLKKNIVEVFFKEINLHKIKNIENLNNREKKWDNIYNYINPINVPNNLKIEEWSELSNLLSLIKNSENNIKPYKNQKLLDKALEAFNIEILKEYVLKIDFYTNDNLDEKDLYNFRRVFLELAIQKNMLTELLNTNFFKLSAFWTKQKIIEKLINNNVNIDEYPFLINFINYISKIENKTIFQKRLLEMYQNNK